MTSTKETKEMMTSRSKFNCGWVIVVLEIKKLRFSLLMKTGGTLVSSLPCSYRYMVVKDSSA